MAAVRNGGAEPALTAVLDGEAHVGVLVDADPALTKRICGPARKVAARDLGVAIGQRWDYGATTVSASLALAARSDINVFATGGIGGVHRGWPDSGDISADLDAIAAHQMITVSAGAKIFLDLSATLERLETLSVPVLGWQTDEFPAFHARSSGLQVPHRVDSPEEVARIARAHWALGGGGILVAAPVPEDDALDFNELSQAVDIALQHAESEGLTGPSVTPAILGALADATDGGSVPTNLALAENNAAIAARLAVALSAVEAT